MHNADLSESEFRDWYYKFIGYYNGREFPAVRFYNEVNESHKAIREKIGGVRKIEEIVLEDLQMQVPLDIVMDLMTPIRNYLPHYYTKYNISEDFLRYPTVPPEINLANENYKREKVKKRKGMSWLKHIEFFLSRDEKAQQLDGVKLSAIGKNLWKLGKHYSLAKTKKQSLWINMTTSPMAFVNIGHYGTDHMACFKQGGQNNHHKYILGIHPNTYVLLVSTSETNEFVEHPKNDNPSIVCRAWGVASNDMTVFNLCNHYPRKDNNISEANILNGMEKFFHSIFGDRTKVVEDIFTMQTVYFNKKIKWSIFDKDKYPKNSDIAADKLNFNLVQKGCMDNNVSCAQCKHPFIVRDLTAIDGIYVCVQCKEKLPTCEYSGTKYAGPGFEAFNRVGKKIKISGLSKSRFFRSCAYSNQLVFLEDLLTTKAGHVISRFYMEKMNMVICKECGACDSGKDGVCTSCSKKTTDYRTQIKTKKQINI